MLLAGIALSGCGTADTAADSFVRVENGQFLLNDKPYYFIGTNFWYGPILGSQGPDGDRGRLARELDALRDRGVTNLRVLVGADGEEGVPCKIEPILQTAPGEYDDALLDGLDYFMREAARRDMKVVPLPHQLVGVVRRLLAIPHVGRRGEGPDPGDRRLEPLPRICRRLHLQRAGPGNVRRPRALHRRPHEPLHEPEVQRGSRHLLVADLQRTPRIQR